MLSIPMYKSPPLFSALNVGRKWVLNVLGSKFLPGKSTDVRAGGVSWKYRRFATAETLSASGTLTQSAYVYILAYTSGNHVRITYEYVMDTPMPPPRPTTQSTNIITRTFSATNQSSGEQWVDHCMYRCVT